MRKIYFPFFVFILFSWDLSAQKQLFGLSTYGGDNGQGTLFHYDPASNLLIQDFSFASQAPGIDPVPEMVEGPNGKFYGLTGSGGVDDGGVIFEWDPVTNVYIKKVDFKKADGLPIGAMVFFEGKFYGMTTYRVPPDTGNPSIFEWDPTTNNYTIKFSSFPCPGPKGSLVLFSGKFYGVTGDCAPKRGSIFEWDPHTNLYKDKVNFSSDGPLNQSLAGTLTVFNEKLYGMSTYGIFEWDPVTNIISQKYIFINSQGVGQLTVANGKFYGVRRHVADASDALFEWDPTSNLCLDRHIFDGPNVVPPGPLTFSGNKLYGIRTNDKSGFIFEWDPSGSTYQKKLDFDSTDMVVSDKPALLFANGKLFGIATIFDKSLHYALSSVIFELETSSNILSKKFDWNKEEGKQPGGSLTFYDGKFYGTTIFGGDLNRGVIFEWNPSTNTYLNRYSLNGDLLAYYPSETLTLYAGKFYGTAKVIQNANSTVLEWDPSANSFVKRAEISGSPASRLIHLNGKFYATTKYGGSNNDGTIFEWDPSTNEFIKRVDFEFEISGANPSPLTLFNGKFYGTTLFIGQNSSGNIGGGIFEWNPNTNDLIGKITFDDPAKGNYPSGSLILVGEKFYGITSQGGVNDSGVIFEWDPESNNYSKKKDLPISYPGRTLNYSDGKFYIKALEGGIYVWDPSTDILTHEAAAENFTIADNCQLLEVVSSDGQIGTDLPGPQVKCPGNASGNVSFSLWQSEDVDPVFTVKSSNITLLTNSNISVNKMGTSEYQVSYVPEPSTSGTTVIELTADNGKGQVTFGFPLTVADLQTTITSNSHDTFPPVLTSSSDVGNQWYLNDKVIEGETGKTFIPQKQGEYKVKVSLKGCTGSFSNALTISITGIGDVESTHNTMPYPNPAHDFINVPLQGFRENTDVSLVVTDNLGRIISTQTETGGREASIDVRNFPVGMYYLRLQQGELLDCVKFIKQ